MTKTKLEEEHVPACLVCGKLWQRKDSKKWFYFNGILVCKEHPGVSDCYGVALKMIDKLLRLGTAFAPVGQKAHR